MTREEAIKILTNHTQYKCNGEDLVALDMAIKALEQEPCEDCISRQVVLDEMYKRQKDGDVITAGFIKKLPSVTPQTKKGRWEWVQYDSNPNIGNWHCSECRTIIPHMPKETDNTPIYKWCPMCGCKMQEVEE